MEYAKQGSLEAALAEFQALIARDADYVAVYFQAGQTLEKLQRVDEACQMYRQGIEVAARLGDAHSRSELQEALDFLE